MNKRQKLKQAKKHQAQTKAAQASLGTYPKVPTVEEAWDVLYEALKNDPRWSSRAYCLFINEETVFGDMFTIAGRRGKLYASADGLEVFSKYISKH